jgi:Protein of unknown function (DUF3822)
MFKATFDIVSETATAGELQNSQLLMEIGEKTFSYIFYDKGRHLFQSFRQYSLDFIPGKTAMETLQDILAGDELLQNKSRESYIVYNYSDSSLLPEKHFHIELNKPVTELVFGNAHKGLLLNEKVIGWDLYTIYRVPREVHSLLQRKFAAGKYWHYYTLLLADIKKEEAGDLVKVIIAADRFVTVVCKKGQLQLIQTYSYQTPEDVSYYLLAIWLCRSPDLLMNNRTCTRSYLNIFFNCSGKYYLLP